MGDASVEFHVLCRMLDAVARAKKAALKCKHIKTFLDHFYTGGEFFSAMRLILPHLDRERGTYGLKESILAKCLTDALGLSKDSEDAQKLLNWRKGGSKAGANAGNFPLVATEVLYRRQRTSSGDLKIKDVNDYLDRLAMADNRNEKTSLLAELINKTNAQEMRWIIMIIIKDLKLGISEKTIFHEFHPDAEDLFNVTCDLKLVCEKLRDRSQRYKRTDIEVGKPVRPQLASRVADADTAWKKLRGKQVVVECKFDGDRIQVHKNGRNVYFFSRNFIDHSEFKDGISSLIVERVKPEKCILDGEMLVWNRMTNRFAEFGSNQEVAKAARDGLETDQQLCYVAFDILYIEDSSVIHQSLRDRHELLHKAVDPLKGRLEILVPYNGMNSHRLPQEPRWSMLAYSVEDVKNFFQDTVENRDEGIVIKDLDSKWEPSDRSGKWLKLKPDYIHTGSDLDALIIGGYFGSGRRGGEVGQFLLGIAEKPKLGGHPTKFLSFCRVGTGLSEEERDVLVSKLKPYFKRNEKSANPPGFYIVTNNAKERPDVWIDQPERSVILEITSDIRTIKSEVFAAPYSLRFPRVNRIRYDKPWYDCLDVQSLVEIVHAGSGSTVDGKQYERLKAPQVSRRTSRKEVKLLPLVPLHMLVTDVSSVREETSIFHGLVFYFINFEPDYPKDILHKMVVENGGSFSMNLNDTVTHAIAVEKKGIRYQSAALHKDIIHQSWFSDCCRQKALLPLRPKYILHLSETSRAREDMDEFGDHFYLDNEVDDLRQLFQNMDAEMLSINLDSIKHYEKKYCPAEDLCNFCCCQVYFHYPIHSANVDSQMVARIALKRLQLDVLMHEGQIESSLSCATHMVVYIAPDNPVSFNTILTSLAPEERNLLKSKSRKINIVSHTWIEDSLTNHKKLPVENYQVQDYALPDSDEEVLIPVFERCNNHLEFKDSSSKTEERMHTTGINMFKNDTTSESDDLTPRRRLYTDSPSKVKPRQRAGTKQQKAKGSKRSRKRKSVTLSGETEEGEKSNANADFSFPYTENEVKAENRLEEETKALNPLCSDVTNETLDAMLFDMVPSFNEVQQGLLEDGMKVHQLGKAESSTDVNAKDGLPPMGNADVALPKKRKVSYKNIVGNLLKA